MPDPIDKALQRLLAYSEENGAGDDLFVVDVMRTIRGERRRRKLILAAFGGIGALFGIAGAVMLSDSIGRVFTESISAMALAQVPLFAVGAAAFYLWCMNDDLAPGT